MISGKIENLKSEIEDRERQINALEKIKDAPEDRIVSYQYDKQKDQIVLGYDTPFAFAHLLEQLQTKKHSPVFDGKDWVRITGAVLMWTEFPHLYGSSMGHRFVPKTATLSIEFNNSNGTDFMAKSTIKLEDVGLTWNLADRPRCKTWDKPTVVKKNGWLCVFRKGGWVDAYLIEECQNSPIAIEPRGVAT